MWKRLTWRALIALEVVLLLFLVLALYPSEIGWKEASVWRARFLEGLWRTVYVSGGALAISIVLGTLIGLVRMSRQVVVQEIAGAYVQLVRGTPFLVQLYIWYFCVASALRIQNLGGEHNAIVLGIVGLGAFGAAYVAEIVRAGVQAVDRGQWEAARSLGLSHRQALRHVILPQAFRTMIPPLTGEAVSLIKESSLLSVVSVAELTYWSKKMTADTFETFAAYLPLAVLYLCLTLPLTVLTMYLERRLAGPPRFPVAEL